MKTTHCQHVQTKSGELVFRCIREVVRGTQFCIWHQPPLPTSRGLADRDRKDAR